MPAPGSKAERSRPAEKCGPVEEITIARARDPASISSTICGSSSQNSGIMLFRFSGRERTMWATRSSTSTSKQR
jgi:hypothetical protein